METKDVILKLRTKKGLSQDELAQKIMVTRQARVISFFIPYNTQQPKGCLFIWNAESLAIQHFLYL